MDTLFIIIPAYNEMENIEAVVEDWYPIVSGHSGDGNSKLVVIDDGSTDGTYTALINLRNNYPLLEPLTKENGGHGSAVLYGYRYALSNRADFVFQTDSDGQTDPDEFEEFWQLRNDFDAIFGNRVSRGDGKRRAFVEKAVCLLVRLYFGTSVPDANAPYRLMRKGYLERILPLMPEDYALPNIILTALGPAFGMTRTFLPISFCGRKAGTQTINMRRIVAIGIKSLKDFASIRRKLKGLRRNEL